MINIRFLPDNKLVKVARGSSVLTGLHHADIHVLASCGGEHLCGECKVRFIEGTPEIDPNEEFFLTSRELQEGWRLACCHPAEDGMQVFVPDETRIRTEKVTSSSLESTIVLKPRVMKTQIIIDPETPVDGRAHEDRIGTSGFLQIPRPASIGIQRKLARFFDRKRHIINAVSSDFRIMAVSPDEIGSVYGLAIDIGTTTVAGLLIDLASGDTVAMQTALNAQANFGADVMSRLNYAISELNGHTTLCETILKTLNGMVRDLCGKADVRREDIYLASVVGNTAMLELFLGLYPVNLAYSPYLPLTTQSQIINACDTGLEINPEGDVQVFPVISGFVGGDMVGVILSSGLDKIGGFKIAIDLGTNGELVAAHNGRLIAAAAAAGPAFEGAQLSCGMPATPGAINSFRVTETDCILTTIGSAKPAGICGSGLIDIVAELLRFGIIDSSGRIVAEPKDGVAPPAHLMKRIYKNGSVCSFIIWEEQDKRIFLSQQDVREFQLAKGAIRAGITVLTEMLGRSEKDLEEIMVAGTFGTFVKKESMIRTGILPSMPLSKISIIGNAACLGAKRGLLNGGELTRAEKIANSVEALNLAAHTGFQEVFVNSILFPVQDEKILFNQ